MVKIEEFFDTSTMSDVTYHAMQTFSEAGLDLTYLTSVHSELMELSHWLIQLHWCYSQMDTHNFFILSQKLNYVASDLDFAFSVISRRI